MKGTILIGEKLGLSDCSDGTAFLIRYTKPSLKANKILLELIPKEATFIEIIFSYHELNDDERLSVYDLKETLLKNLFTRLTILH
jgi:hypothetical protein